MNKLLILIATFLVGIVNSASAQPSSQISFSYDRTPTIQNPVEQFLPDTVTNPTSCLWDIDDNSQASGYGDLDKNSSVSWSECQIVEAYNSPNASCISGCGRPYSVNVLATSISLDVQTCFSPDPRCFQLTPVWNPVYRAYDYSICLRMLFPYEDPNLQEIPNSNGGIGIIANQTLLIYNPTNKIVRKISAFINQIGFAQNDNFSCHQDDIDVNVDGAYRWTTP